METRKILSIFVALTLFSLMASSTNITTVLSSIEGNFSVVWAYNSSDTSDPWKSYIPGDAYVSINDLNDIFPNYGYWVRINASSETLSVTGSVPSSTSTTLVQGWNLVGYPSTTGQNITTALSSISGNYSVVWAYNSSDTSDPWKSYIPGDAYVSINDLNIMNPGFGYWVRINSSSETLTI